MTNIPKVTVLMPVYRGDKYLPEAVDSILNQTFRDFEFLIICDDPTAETCLLLSRYQQSDNRMQVYYQGKEGLVNSLNKGLSLAKGKYVSRMDADDISLPNRLEKQVDFMDENPDIGISGTWIKTIGDVMGDIWKHPCDHDTIKSKMLFESVIVHPSVILRKNVFCRNGLYYSQNETYAEDYGLWVRSIKKLKFANIPEILLHYRVHKSTSNKDKQKKVANNVRYSQIKELGINPTKDEFEIHESLSYYKIESSRDFIIRTKLWLEKLQHTNSKVKIYSEPAFSRILADYWFFICSTSTTIGLDSWYLFNKSVLYNSIKLSEIQKVKYILRAMIKHP